MVSWARKSLYNLSDRKIIIFPSGSVLKNGVIDEISRVITANENAILCLNGATQSQLILQNVTHSIPQCLNDNFAINFKLAKRLFSIVLDKKYKQHWAETSIGTVLYRQFYQEYSKQLEGFRV